MGVRCSYIGYRVDISIKIPSQSDRLDLFCCVQKKDRKKVDDSHERGFLERMVADKYTPFIMRK